MMKQLPTRLYKYRNTGQCTEMIFSKQELYFAPPSAFNDPFDCGFHVLCGGEDNETVLEAAAFQTVRQERPGWSVEDALDAAKQVAAEMASNRKDETIQVFKDKLADDSNNKAGILSLTEANDNIVMWTHYADEHKGLCLEFRTDIEETFFTDAVSIVYDDKYPSLNLREIVEDPDLRKAAPWMLTKSTTWGYEQEWRVLEFQAGPGPRTFPAHCLSAVFLGCRIPEDEREKVMQWVSDFPSNVAVHQAHPSSTDFCLTFEQIR